MTPPCVHCGADWDRHGGHGLCRACFAYQWRTGRPRPATLYQPAPWAVCQCGRPTRARAGTACRACLQYRWRTGRARPAHLWRPDLPRKCRIWWCDVWTAQLRRGLCSAHYSCLWRRHGAAWRASVQAQPSRAPAFGQTYPGDDRDTAQERAS